MKKPAKKAMSKSPMMKKMHEKKESMSMKMKEMRKGGKS
jgi:hypothetical protein